MSERKEIVLEPPVMTRNAALHVISLFFNAHKSDGIKSMRFDHAPLDKKGDIIDMIVYAFREQGDYVMFFPKRVRVPLKTGSQEQFRSSIATAIDKISSVLEGLVQVGFVDGAINVALDEYFKAEEDRAIANLSQFDRTFYLIGRMKANGTIDRINKEQAEKKAKARQELESHFAVFDAMSDEGFHQLVNEHVVRCNSDEYYQEMLPTWMERGIQSEVTPTLRAVESYIMERGPELVPEWSKEKTEFERDDYYCEFHSYRGFTIRFSSGGIASVCSLYKDDGVFLIGF